MRTTVGLSVLLAVLALVHTGCGTTGQARDVNKSGFLGDYSKLSKGTGDEALLRYWNPNVDFKRYDKIIIESVTLWAKSEGSLKDVPKKDREMLCGAAFAELTKALGKDYTLVTEPGPGTLRLKAALTETIGSSAVLDTVTTVLPQPFVVSKVTSLITGTDMFVGSASIEVDVRDAVTDERIVCAADRRVGRKSAAGMTRTWSTVLDGCEYWAERIRRAFEEHRKN